MVDSIIRMDKVEEFKARARELARDADDFGLKRAVHDDVDFSLERVIFALRKFGSVNFTDWQRRLIAEARGDLSTLNATLRQRAVYAAEADALQRLYSEIKEMQ